MGRGGGKGNVVCVCRGGGGHWGRGFRTGGEVRGGGAGGGGHSVLIMRRRPSPHLARINKSKSIVMCLSLVFQ